MRTFFFVITGVSCDDVNTCFTPPQTLKIVENERDRRNSDGLIEMRSPGKPV